MYICVKDIKHSYFSICLPVVFCSPLSNIENGNITYTTPLDDGGYIVDTLAQFYCDSGYRFSVSSAQSRRCERSGHWSGQTPTCIEGIDSNI